MNAYYQNTNINTNIGRTLPRENIENTRKIGDGLIDFLCSLVALLTCPVAMIMVKAALCVVTFVAFFGVIGGIECGAISMFFGIVICLALSLVEALLLKSMVKKSKA